MKNKEYIPNNEKKESKLSLFFKTFTVKQLIWFILSLCLIAFSLTFIVLGLIDDNTNFYYSPIEAPNTSMKEMMAGIGFTWFGVITLLLGTIILAFTLSLSSKIEDRYKEKEARRKERLSSIKKEQKNKDSFESTIEVK